MFLKFIVIVSVLYIHMNTLFSNQQTGQTEIYRYVQIYSINPEHYKDLKH